MFALSLLTMALLLGSSIGDESLQGGSTWYVNAAGSGLGTGTASDPFTNIAYGVSRSFVGSGDIFLVAPGTYDDEEIDFFGKSLIVRSTDGPAVTTIIARPMMNPSDPHAAARLRSSEEVLIEGFRFTGGTGSLQCTGFTEVVGGAIEACAGADLTVRNCFFETNTAEKGGAIYVQDASIHIEDCHFSGPGTEARGEAVYLLRADAEITGSTFEGLYYVAPHIPRGGGAIVVDRSTLHLADCLFERNATRFFGAHIWSRSGDVVAERCTFGSSTGYAGASISASGGTLRIIDSTIRLARAIQAPGAGIFGSNADVLVDGCLFEANHVDGTREGGAIAVQAGRLTVTDSRFIRNRAGQGGAIVTSQSANTLIQDCQFVGNVAPNGGGAFYSGDSFATIERSIFRGNLALPSGAGGAVGGRALLNFCTLAYNSSGTNGGGAANGAVLAHSIAWGNSPTDLGPTVIAGTSLVGSPGGATLHQPIAGDPRYWATDDLHVLPGSPAIDAAPGALGLDPDGSRKEIGARGFQPDYIPAGFGGDIGWQGCLSAPNSAGTVASLIAFGSLDIVKNRLLVRSAGLPTHVPTLLLAARSDGMLTVPGMLGPLCLGSPFLRLISLQAPSRADGTAATWIRLRGPASDPGSGDLTVQGGDTWHFQLWYRDANGNSVTNTSSAVQVTLH